MWSIIESDLNDVTEALDYFPLFSDGHDIVLIMDDKINSSNKSFFNSTFINSDLNIISVTSFTLLISYFLVYFVCFSPF